MKFKLPNEERSMYYSSTHARERFVGFLESLNWTIIGVRFAHVILGLIVMLAVCSQLYPNVERPQDGWMLAAVLTSSLTMLGIACAALPATMCGWFSELNKLPIGVNAQGLRMLFINSFCFGLWCVTLAELFDSFLPYVTFWIFVCVQSVVCGFGVHYYIKAHHNKERASWKQMLGGLK